MPINTSTTKIPVKPFMVKNPNSNFFVRHIAPTNELLTLCRNYLENGGVNNTEFLKILWCYLVSLDRKLYRELQCKNAFCQKEKSDLKAVAVSLITAIEKKIPEVGESDRAVYAAWINGLFRARDKDDRRTFLVDPLQFPEFTCREWLLENAGLGL